MTAKRAWARKSARPVWTGFPTLSLSGTRKIAAKKLTVTIRKKSQPNKPFKDQMTVEALDRRGPEGYRGQAVPAALHAAEALDEGTVYLNFFFTFFGSVEILKETNSRSWGLQHFMLPPPPLGHPP